MIHILRVYVSALLIKRIGEGRERGEREREEGRGNGWKRNARVQKKAIVGFYVGVGERLWFMVVVCDRYMTAGVTDRASTMCLPRGCREPC